MDFSGLKGMTLVAIVRNRDDDELTFTTSKGLVFKMFHQQD